MKQCFTIKEAAQYLSVSEATIRRRLKDFDAFKIGSSIRIKLQSLENYCNKNTISTNTINAKKSFFKKQTIKEVLNGF